MSLTAIAVFRNMSVQDLSRVLPACTFTEPNHGATIFAQGDPADSVCAIVAGDGHVRIGAVDRNSKALMVEVFRIGEIFGEVGVIDGGSRTASAVAMGKMRLVKIRGAAFLAAMASSAPLGDAMCRMMAQRLRRTFELFQDATFETLEVRLARQILYLSARGDLADLLGGTTRSIITILNGWRAAGFIIYDTDRALLTVCDVAALRAIVGSDREPWSNH
jgi:CRP-like cAMP-binding protein